MRKIIAIIPSAGKPQNQLFPGVYDPMIPINGKPTIDYILGNLQKLGIKKVIVLLNENDIKSYEYLLFRKINIETIIKRVNTNNLGETILSINEIINSNEILIHLGDSIYTGKFDFTNDNIGVQNKKVLSPEKWCFINNENNFINGPSEVLDNYKLVIGLYYIKNTSKFIELLLNNNFYDSLTKYSNSNKIGFQEINNGYYDLGHLDEYYKSKIDFLRVRSFNSFEYDKFKGIITKKSSNGKKLEQEINWFNSIPNDLKIFTPRLVNYNLKDNISYSLEFYGYTSLADIFLYSNYSQSILSNVLDKILDYTKYVKSNYSNVEFKNENIENIYLDKTFDRLNKLLENTDIKNIYNQTNLVINGTKYKNISYFIDKKRLKKIINEYIINTNDVTIIHGDMCFSNILFDVHNGLFKLIDPRGNFGIDGIWGDIKYDIAKLRHSVHGRYENIISDLFNFKEDNLNSSYSFQYFNGENIKIINEFDNKVSKLGYNVEVIKFIEGLLYLTMIPLHSDNLERQKIMYLTATVLFNETEKLGK